MLMPSIHLNGSAPRQLIEDNLDAAHHVREALAALARAAPNGRDYYPQGEGAYRQARAEHDARADKLRSILTDLDALSEHVSALMDRRRA